MGSNCATAFAEREIEVMVGAHKVDCDKNG